MEAIVASELDVRSSQLIGKSCFLPQKNRCRSGDLGVAPAFIAKLFEPSSSPFGVELDGLPRRQREEGWLGRKVGVACSAISQCFAEPLRNDAVSVVGVRQVPLFLDQRESRIDPG